MFPFARAQKETAPEIIIKATNSSGRAAGKNSTTIPFSLPWVEELSAREPGCEQGTNAYLWRHAGWGSNMNS